MAEHNGSRARGQLTRENQRLDHKNLLPYLGARPISSLRPSDILITAQRMAARDAVESGHQVRKVCEQIVHFAVANGIVERISADLKGALATPEKTNYAEITDPNHTITLMRSTTIGGISCHGRTQALNLFVRSRQLRRHNRMRLIALKPNGAYPSPPGSK
ncbi:phage integrase central domain-containing protein [Duganella sp. PWIR1]